MPTCLSTGYRPAVCGFALVTSLIFASPDVLRAGDQDVTQRIDVGGHKLRAKIEGPVREGQPTVVLVGGLGDSLEIWRRVQPAVAQLTRVVSYDRAGLGQSEPDSAAPTPQRIATQLRTLLQNAGVKPPYVLVGHSIGGPHVRMFAGLYPGEVSGLVYVDPSDFTQTYADQLALWTALGPGEAGLKGQYEQAEKQFASAAPALRAEAEVSARLLKSGWEDFRSLAPLPDIPVVILVAAKVDLPQEVKMIIGKQRFEHLGKLALEVPEGALVVTNRSGHYIHLSEPDLVTWAIRRALYPDPERRLALAVERGGGAAAVKEYRSMKVWYPVETFTEGLLNRLGYERLRGKHVEDAFVILKLNAEEYPKSFDVYDSLGEVHAARGEWTLAITNYEESLRLNPANQNGVEWLGRLRKCAKGETAACPSP